MAADAAPQDLVAALAKHVPPQRLAHSRSVAHAARQLAERFAPELAGKAEIAGLLHDNARDLPDAELIAAAERHDIGVSAGERRRPVLLHGKVGAALLAERFGVVDAEVAQAVADHVTGREGMRTLSLILIVADQLSADRDFPGVAELRRVAEYDLERAAFMAARNKLIYVVQQEESVEPPTVAVYNELLERVSRHRED